jgi:plasmid stabilization system protein ParE
VTRARIARQVRHPLMDRDLIEMAEHIARTTGGDVEAALRRLDEVDELIRDIAANPASGARLAGPLSNWLVRHGGRGRRVTIVFRAEAEAGVLYIALVAFGGRNWMAEAEGRQRFGR